VILLNRYKKSKQILKKFHEIVPAASHTYSKGEDQFPYESPQIMSHAKGAYCWDVDGNKFIDWGMGNRVIILGHAYPAVNRAVKQAIDAGTNFTRPGILEYELAQYLVDLWPAAEMVKFGKNGSDVTTSSIKLARAYTNRKYVAVCQDHPFFSIHDWFIGTTACNAGIPPESYKYTIKFPYNDIESIEKMFKKYKNQIACFILEPVKNDEPRDDFLKHLREITEKHNTVLIFDEMISGVRFDVRGAHHLWKVYPDLVCFGKCISNGFSISVLAGKKEILERGGLKHKHERVFLLSQTHGSETTGLVAARATLDECQRLNVNKHIWKTGKILVEGIRKAGHEENVSDHVRVIGFDCNPQILCTHADGTYWPELHTTFHEEVIASGVLIPWTSITYSHKRKEVELTLEALRKGMKKVRKVLDRGNVEKSFEGDAVKPVFRKYN